jgi:hypothetical protein
MVRHGRPRIKAGEGQDGARGFANESGSLRFGGLIGARRFLRLFSRRDAHRQLDFALVSAPRMDDVNASLARRQPVNGAAEPRRDSVVIDVFDVAKSVRAQDRRNVGGIETAGPTFGGFLLLLGSLRDELPHLARERLGRLHVVEHDLRVRD